MNLKLSSKITFKLTYFNIHYQYLNTPTRGRNFEFNFSVIYIMHAINNF